MEVAEKFLNGIYYVCSTTFNFFFFVNKKLKKSPSKVANTQINFSPSWAAQTDQTEEFMFENVAHRPTVYKTGTRKSFSNSQKTNYQK